ncbi:hypothetical protein [Brevibacterium gallinarum]|uniref:Uncharacterized protein n=1 Tax=Brevibacterium gallinarum TaxID=2762220 RepID=A0ABR8WRL9_9MICO|nr:hypothetical protein [Brevibacterium gallinarum]MBD8019391.1 hypothetical protein [Brevibacterium gallinarum]
MAEKKNEPKNDSAEKKTEQPEPAPAVQPAAPAVAKQPEPVKATTLVLGDYEITTTHPGEIASLRAQGYQVKK